MGLELKPEGHGVSTFVMLGSHLPRAWNTEMAQLVVGVVMSTLIGLPPQSMARVG